MRKHHAVRIAVLVAVLTTAAILVPTPAAAHAQEPTTVPVRTHEYITARTATMRLMPALNRGTVVAVLADDDLDRSGRSA